MANKESFLKRFLGEMGQTFFGKNLPETIIKTMEKKGKQIGVGVEIFFKHNHDPAAIAEEQRRS